MFHLFLPKSFLLKILSGAFSVFSFGGVFAFAASSEEIESLVKRVAERQFELQRERDRNGRFKSEFNIAGQAGGGAKCWAEQRVRKLEILVGGAHLETGSPKESGKAYPSTGNPALIKFVFSESFIAQIENEEQYQLFAPSGKFVSEAFNGKLIRDIAFLKIEKGGVGWDSSRFSKSCFLGINCGHGYKNFETNRYSLGSITVKVNDQVVYSRAGINHTFQDGSLVWEESNLAVNPEYIKLMARTECPVNQ
jgi:hypothetical protein